MTSRAVLLLLFGTCASGLSDVEISNVDRVDPPSFVTTSVSISFNMNCNDETANACFTRTATAAGTFARSTFETNLMTAVNAHALSVSSVAANAWVMTSANFKWDRVVESTAPFSASMVATIDGSTVVDANYWNVFVRFTLTEVPVEVVADIKLAMAKLYTSYAGINYNSLWISTDAHFITEQLEPVKGRGHKDRKLLIPLILGVVAMLTIPMLVSWMLVKLAEQSNQADVTVNRKSKVIAETQNTLAGKNAAIATHTDADEARNEEKMRCTEMKIVRDKYEINEDDVDWEAQKLTNQPFGN